MVYICKVNLCWFYMKNELSQFVKKRRKVLGLNQVELSEKAGVGLRFVRDLEQG